MLLTVERIPSIYGIRDCSYQTSGYILELIKNEEIKFTSRWRRAQLI